MLVGYRLVVFSVEDWSGITMLGLSRRRVSISFAICEINSKISELAASPIVSLNALRD